MWNQILAALSLILLATAAPAETFVVNPSGTGDYPTIQAAINAAVDGDIIELTDGVFRGDGNRDIEFFGKAITVRSQSGNAEDCTIDCQGSASERHRGFLFRNNEGPNAVLEQLTIIRGYPPGGMSKGGAVLCLENVSPTLRDCRFVLNHATFGGGVYCDHSSPNLDGCEFIANTTSGGGGGMISVHGAPVLTRCVFFRNTAAEYGGGFKGAGDAFTVFEKCTFAWNTSLAGGGVYT